MKTEQFKSIEYTSPKAGDKIKLYVGEYGTVKYDGKVLKQQMMDQRQGYMYAIPPSEAKFKGLLPVHRLVAIAWVDGRTNIKNIVHHKDAVRTHNYAFNLEWTTHKENNGTESARWKHGVRKTQKHDTECVKAEKDGQVMYFKNGRAAARYIGCTSPQVYMTLNPKHWCKTCHGWKLSRVELNRKHAVELIEA